jgi:glycosyltransferase involved in cell wall biosynthesis
MIEAIHLVRDKWPNLLFAIVGEGRALAGLKKKVGELGLNGQVLFFGKRPFSEMASFIRQARIGVVPHYRYPQTDGGAPHKFFQYMSVGKPVLVSNCSTLERIVRTHNSGVVFHAGDVNDLAQKLLTLKDQSLRKKLGENGRKAMEGPLHLKRQQRKLNNKIAELLNT